MYIVYSVENSIATIYSSNNKETFNKITNLCNVLIGSWIDGITISSDTITISNHFIEFKRFTQGIEFIAVPF